MSIESTRRVMTQYFESEHTDVSVMADDVVFTIMSTGQEHRGPKAIEAMLDYFYRGAFDAHATTDNTIFSNGKALVEGTFIGRHVGEFAGVPATHRDVRVPICVVYDLENDQIHRARVYVDMGLLMQQIGGVAASAPATEPQDREPARRKPS